MFLIGCVSKDPLNSTTTLGKVSTQLEDRILTSQPIPFLKEKSISILANKNFGEYSKSFNLEADARIQIEYVGEILILEPKLAHEFDGIQLFFDCNNEKFIDFDSQKDDKQFVLNQTQLIDGVDFVQVQTSHNRYIIEAKIPWTKLKVTPHSQMKFGFDIMINDNDKYKRDKCIIWHSKDPDLYINTSLYGDLMLGSFKAPFIDSFSTAVSKYSAIRPLIDGKKDLAWIEAYTYTAKHLGFGEASEDNDLKATYKLLWDNMNLYILAEVEDDAIVFRSKNFVMCDFGWIEDENKKIIWRVEPEKTIHAGGAFKNRKIDTVLHVQKGKYFLKYNCDESHSFDKWDDDPPFKKDFYGIGLKRLD